MAGQFYTTNYEYILQGLTIPNDTVSVIEPFAGQGDLVEFAGTLPIECYDIDPKQDYIVQRDTLMDPPVYTDKFVLTNPPYLARNKSTDKTVFDKYQTNDLYKCFLLELIKQKPIGGILIVPLNFLCSIRKSDTDLRRQFLNVFSIRRINIFEEQVFDDTTYTTCSFQFDLRRTRRIMVDIHMFPSDTNFRVAIGPTNNYTVGGEIYKLAQRNDISVDRWTRLTDVQPTNILVKSIDDGPESLLRLEMVSDDERYRDNTPKLSARSYATLVIQPSLSLDEQRTLVDRFNTYMTQQRARYHSLFLSNYRNHGRKRISFGLVYSIVNFMLI